MRHERDDRGAGEKADRPAPRRADRALRTAAHQPERSVQRRDGLAARHPPRRAAPHQQAAERDDEGRHAEISDDKTLQRAEPDADEEPGRERDDPGRRIFEADELRQQIDLHDAHHHAEKAEHRPDRQIDVAGDDDQHHSRRHDGDRRRLHRQIPQIARREKQPARKQVERDPDQRQRADHAEHAGIEFGGFEKARERKYRASRRRRRRFLHWPPHPALFPPPNMPS